MLHRLRNLALLSFAVLALNGCYAGHHHHVRSHHHGGGDLAFAATVGLITGAAIVASAESERAPEPERVYYQPVSYYYVNAPATPASPKDRVTSEENQGFDAKSARAALGAVDLATCRAEGAPRGYGHAKVTFNPDGKASKVVVDTPDGLSPSAVKCIGDRLGAVSVPEYEGSFITVGTTWFVP
jgi:hypothetical protein